MRMSAVKAHCSSDGLRICLRLCFQGPSDGRSNRSKIVCRGKCNFLICRSKCNSRVAFTLAIKFCCCFPALLPANETPTDVSISAGGQKPLTCSKIRRNTAGGKNYEKGICLRSAQFSRSSRYLDSSGACFFPYFRRQPCGRFHPSRLSRRVRSMCTSGFRFHLLLDEKESGLLNQQREPVKAHPLRTEVFPPTVVPELAAFIS